MLKSSVLHTFHFKPRTVTVPQSTCGCRWCERVGNVTGELGGEKGGGSTRVKNSKRILSTYFMNALINPNCRAHFSLLHIQVTNSEKHASLILI